MDTKAKIAHPYELIHLAKLIIPLFAIDKSKISFYIFPRSLIFSIVGQYILVSK